MIDGAEIQGPSEKDRGIKKELGRSSVELDLAKAEIDDALVVKLRLFSEKFKPGLDTIYVPGSSGDLSVVKAFLDTKGSKFVYVEGDKDFAGELSAAKGITVHNEDPESFKLTEAADLAVMVNALANPEKPSAQVKEGGLFVCDDRFMTAEVMSHNEEYEVVGIVTKGEKDGTVIEDPEEIKQHFTDVETEEEFKNAPKEYGTANYDDVKDMVIAILGEDTTDVEKDILSNYKKLLTLALEQKARGEAEKLQGEDSRAFMRAIHDSELVYRFEGHTYILNRRLPKKKGSAEDLYVFKKKTKNTD